jgi:glutamate-1-semialdehyde aminotransferase
VRRGVLVHPMQAWYLCAALTDAQVDSVLERAADSFADVAEEIANPTRGERRPTRGSA